jgi:hypothetical protein
VKYSDGLKRLSNEETVLMGLIGRLTEIGTPYGMEMNVEKAKVKGI